VYLTICVPEGDQGFIVLSPADSIAVTNVGHGFEVESVFLHRSGRERRLFGADDYGLSMFELIPPDEERKPDCVVLELLQELYDVLVPSPQFQDPARAQLTGLEYDDFVLTEGVMIAELTSAAWTAGSFSCELNEVTREVVHEAPDVTSGEIS